MDDETAKANREAAAREGRSRYEGRPCTRCGEKDRYVRDSRCVCCQRMHSHLYRQRQKDWINRLRAEGNNGG